MSKYPVVEFDIFYISFDEPRAEEFWSDLQNKAPWAQRVHGVLGFDAAHKECAAKTGSNFFVTVDGDNIVQSKFFDQVVEIKDDEMDCAWSWDGYNYANGLEYGNGGLKLWSKAFVAAMESHENAKNSKYAVDFCWDKKYHEFPGCFSITYTNGSPFQSFRAGFREGVKMSLSEGTRLVPDNFKSMVYRENFKRLIGWCTLGADVENGLWGIYGARLGASKTLGTDWNYKLISDYSWFKAYWAEEIAPRFAGDEYTCPYTGYRWKCEILLGAIKDLGDTLRKTAGLPVAEVNSEVSKFIKDYTRNGL